MVGQGHSQREPGPSLGLSLHSLLTSLGDFGQDPTKGSDTPSQEVMLLLRFKGQGHTKQTKKEGMDILRGKNSQYQALQGGGGE